MADVINLSICNFKDYNPRQDRKNFTWFRFQNDFYVRPKIFTLTQGQKILATILLCEASKKNDQKIEVTVPYLSALSGTAAEEIINDLKVLEEIGFLRCHDDGVKPADDRHYARLRTYERTNVRTNEQTAAHTNNASLEHKPQAVVQKKKSQSKTHEAIAHYCDLWKAKHGNSPPISGKDAGIMKRVIQPYGLEKTKQLLDGYFGMPDSFLQQRAHPLELFEGKVKEIYRFITTGQHVSRNMSFAEQRSAHNAQLFREFGEENNDANKQS